MSKSNLSVTTLRRRAKALAEAIGCRVTRKKSRWGGTCWWVWPDTELYLYRPDPCEFRHSAMDWGQVLEKLELYRADILNLFMREWSVNTDNGPVRGGGAVRAR
jgi:hypothetical protein